MTKLEKNNLFVTPNSAADIDEYVKLFPAKQQIALFTVAAMSWNLACEVADSDQSKARALHGERIVARLAANGGT